MQEMRQHFRPEFLNRVDGIVMLKSLTLSEMENVVDLLIDDLRARLSDRRISLTISEEARTLGAREGHDPVCGARPFRRSLQRELETRIGRALIGGGVADGGAIRVCLDNGELVVHKGLVHTHTAAA
jgi:ATP-dependent Clp protease ATP-binding subunit ClpB